MQQQQQQNEGDIASDPAHAIRSYGEKNMTLFFFSSSFFKYLSLNTMSAL